MNQNQFLIYNDFLYSIYTAEDEESRNRELLSYLHMLIPGSYVSYMGCDLNSQEINFTTICALPAEFARAEERYAEIYREDPTQWSLYSKDSVVFRESDLFETGKRLQSAVYQECYREWDVYDTLQLSIVYQRRLVGIVTLFHTRQDGPFAESDIALMKAMSPHLNYIYGRPLAEREQKEEAEEDPRKVIPDDVHLTMREREVLGLVYQARSNPEICEELHITGHTLQKHLQNIYRKLGISSRLELFQFRL